MAVRVLKPRLLVSGTKESYTCRILLGLYIRFSTYIKIGDHSDLI